MKLTHNDITHMAPEDWEDLFFNYYSDEIKNERAVYQSAFRQKPPTSGPFLWLTHDGDLVKPKDMATPHLYFAVRMIFNHTLPAEYRTPGGYKQYADVPAWSEEYKKAAIKELIAELNTRNPKGLTPEMQDGLRWMDIASRAYLAEQAPQSARNETQFLIAPTGRKVEIGSLWLERNASRGDRLVKVNALSHATNKVQIDGRWAKLSRFNGKANGYSYVRG